MKFSGDSKAVVAYVTNLLVSLKENSALTMTIVRARSEDYFVTSVIDELSGDTEMQEYSKELMNIYSAEQDGLSLKE